MKVTTIGTGYVGLVTGACLAEMGNHVVCLDVNPEKIRVLNDGEIPIHEPGLLEVVRRNAAAGRLQFTTDVDMAVKHGTLLTPSPQDGALEGITRGALLELAGEARIPAREKRLTRYDVYTADECFLSGTGAEVMPIAEVDGRKIGTTTPGPVTKQLLGAFHALVRREGDPIW